MFMIAQAAGSGGITLERIVRDIPHDGPAMVVYALLIIFVGMIWLGSRNKTST